MIQAFKQIFSCFKPLLEILEWTLKLYCLTLVIPLAFTFIGIVFWILGILAIDFTEMLKWSWIDFYITGHIDIIPIYRIQIVILLICFLISVDNVIGRKYDKI